ncbi:hypothetical protein [Streptomyces sp. NPDC046870]
MHQGEDLGLWVRLVRLGWDNLTTGQQDVFGSLRGGGGMACNSARHPMT